MIKIKGVKYVKLYSSDWIMYCNEHPHHEILNIPNEYELTELEIYDLKGRKGKLKGTRNFNRIYFPYYKEPFEIRAKFKYKKTEIKLKDEIDQLELKKHFIEVNISNKSVSLFTQNNELKKINLELSNKYEELQCQNNKSLRT